MLKVAMTDQEKKNLAVVYGFLVDVWMARQSKLVPNLFAIKREYAEAGKTRSNLN